MLSLLGFLTVVIMVALIMTKKLHPIVALIMIPIVAALIAGEGANLGEYITSGLTSIAPTGVMFIFAILFFGVLTDAGTFEPIINRILRIVGKDPVKIAIGTVALASIIHLDGSGAVTFLIAIPALLPLYDKLGMSRLTLATLVALAAGVMNMLPWGGPTLRAITALDTSVEEVFTPMVIPMLSGLLFVFFIAVLLGRKERKKLGATLDAIVIDPDQLALEEDPEKVKHKRPQLFIFNILLILVVVGVLISAVLPPAVVFMLGTCLALLVNYRDVKTQKERIDNHAKSALMMASTLFAAGTFIGIMTNSGMIEAMSGSLVSVIPDSLGGTIPVIVGLLAMPLSFLFDPDSYYFGIMPVIAHAFETFGGDPVMVARASIIGQMSTGFPISPLTPSTFLLVGLAGVDLGEHQKKTFIYAYLTTLFMLVVGLVIGVIAL